MQKLPTFKEAFWFWLKLGFISFGGPTGQIAIMHSELVERKRWVSEERFLHALNFCMLLPGPEAQQLATYNGWLLHGWRGGLVAGSLFVLPSALILWGLSYLYVSFGTLPWMAALFYGLKTAVVAIVISALMRLGAKTLKTWRQWSLALMALVGLALLQVPFPLVILGAAAFGFWFGSGNESVPTLAEAVNRPNWKNTVSLIFGGICIWWAPILVAGLLLGWTGTLFQQGLFFSKAAMVTFGGAYAVLPYVAQQAVETFQWLTANQMLDGLGLAETTPGPLIMVLEFVGFLGGWHQPGSMPPVVAATLGAAITVWATFVPCFIWIFAFAPYLERLRGMQRLSGALSAVTAAVLGVICNLAIWFSWHALFPKGHPDWFGLGLSALALMALVRWKVNMLVVLGVCAVAGLLKLVVL